MAGDGRDIGEPPPPYAFETIAIWLRNIGTDDDLPAPVEEVAHLLSEIERLEDKCNRQATVLQRLFPDRHAGVYFVCGEGGEKDGNGLPDRIHVCPAYGCGWSEIYTRASFEPPKHKYWRPGEADCPREIKAPNGELHTLRCKVCGQDDPRSERCNPAEHPLAQMVRLDEEMGLYDDEPPLAKDEESRSVEIADATQRMAKTLGCEFVPRSQSIEEPDGFCRMHFKECDYFKSRGTKSCNMDCCS